MNAAESSGEEMKTMLCIVHMEPIGDFKKVFNRFLGIKITQKGLGGE